MQNKHKRPSHSSPLSLKPLSRVATTADLRILDVPPCHTDKLGCLSDFWADSILTPSRRRSCLFDGSVGPFEDSCTYDVSSLRGRTHSGTRLVSVTATQGEGANKSKSVAD